MKKTGFTLAEILITLGVIGVVSAITIPIINTSIQKKVLPIQLKVFYADFSNALRRYMADNDFVEIKDTPFGDNQLSESEKRELFVNDVLMSYIGGQKGHLKTKYTSLNSSKLKYNLNWDFVSNKGYSIQVSNGLWNSNLTILFDINGSKGPNRGGYDVFRFYLYDIPTPKQAYQRLEDWNCRNCGDCCRPDLKADASGYGCWARIIKDGYKINY